MSNAETMTNVQMTRKMSISHFEIQVSSFLRPSSFVLRPFFHAPRAKPDYADQLA